IEGLSNNQELKAEIKKIAEEKKGEWTKPIWERRFGIGKGKESAFNKAMQNIFGEKYGKEAGTKKAQKRRK
ncbi:MAG: hypothetical protein DRO04_02895, partial [Candidatus Iainarchaeum archaeon]